MTVLFLAFDTYFLYAQTLARIFSQSARLVSQMRYASGEIKIGKLDYSVAHKTIVIIQSITTHDELYAIMHLVYTLKNAGAHKIILVSPYIFYSRSDKAQEFKTIIHMLESSGIQCIITVELHNIETLSWFSIPVIHITLDDLLCAYISQHSLYKDTCLISPDQGGGQRVERLAEKTSLPAIICTKERKLDNVYITLYEQSITYQHALIIDDIIDTGKTICLLSNALYRAGIPMISGVCVHPVFSTDKKTIIQQARLIDLVTTNTIIGSNNIIDITPSIVNALAQIM